ncbi:hypothetical protein C8Q78DRAFT_1109814 [Trametes maxima]|nr:hypothetical protein C8Q78DRAFT_1109814 [Trametes maxima]
MSHLLAKYPAAITDFYGSGTPCVYKSGPPWPVAQGPQSQKIRRAARPIYRHGIAPIWPQTAWAIVATLDSLHVDWNAVDPLAYANAGQPALICEFVVIISVKPHSLEYETALVAAEALSGILEEAGFPDIQVAFIESVYRRQGKLMGFDPAAYELQGFSGLRKPFTPTLGLAIAPHKSPHHEGTGGLYLRLNTDESDTRTVLLTCAHVAHPPPLSQFGNREYTRRSDTQPRENIILLGSGAFDDSVLAIMKFIGGKVKSIETWDEHLKNIPEPVEGEPAAFIQIDDYKLEMKHFKGNRLFVGGNKSADDWENYMFPQPHDRRDFHVLEGLLLPLQDYVREAEFRDPQNYDVHNVKTLLAVKNGRTTGTTYGRVNGLESITRHYPEAAVEILVCRYDIQTGEIDRFSEVGDSGSIVAGRDGRIIGLLSGGGGPVNKTDRTYITPFYALKKEIEKKYPKACLLPVDG